MSELFWDFSVRTYRCDDVPEACLALQDERGIDVNMLLYCLWYGATRGHQDLECFNRVFDFSESWADHVVRPLRGVRSWMKRTGCVDSRVAMKECMDYREKVKGVEFIGEKMQQEVLQSLTVEPVKEGISESEQLQAIVENIQQYFVVISVELDKFAVSHLTTITTAALPGSKADDIVHFFKSEG